MYQVGARELKQHTGEVLERVQRGERVLLTHRGSPIAVIAPLDRQAVEGAVAKEAERAESEAWLALSTGAFDFWNNPADAVWDEVQGEAAE